MRLSGERMGEHGLRGLAGLSAVAPSSSMFWGAPQYPGTFLPARALNKGATAPVLFGFLKMPDLPGFSPTELFATRQYASRAFYAGLRGNYSPLPRPPNAPGMLASGSVLNADPAQWQALYEYAYQIGVETAKANPDIVFYRPEPYAVVNIAGPHPVDAVIDDYSLMQLRAGKKVAFVDDEADTFMAPGDPPRVVGAGNWFGNSQAKTFSGFYGATLTAKQMNDARVQQVVSQLSQVGESGGGGLLDTIKGAVSGVVSLVQEVTAPVVSVAQNVVQTAQATVQAAGDAIAHPTITNLTKAIGLQTGMQFTAGAGGADTTEKIGKVIDTAAVIGTAAVFVAPALTGTGTSIPGSSLLAPIKSTLTAAQMYQKLEQQKKEEEAQKQAEADAADLAARKKILADLQAKQAAQPKNILSNPLAWLALAGSFLL